MSPSRRLRRLDLAALLLWLGAAIVTGVEADLLPMVREQELRVALTARAMASGGSWLTPTYRGRLRFQKPPLLYWVTAAAGRVFSAPRSAFVARLGGLASAWALLAAVYLGGRRLVGRRAAWSAMAVTAASYLFLRFAPRSETDMAQSLWSALAVLGVWSALVGRCHPAWAWSSAGVAAGLGALSKSPAPAVLAALVAAGGAFLVRSPRRDAFRWAGVGAAACLAVAAPWYAYAFSADAVEAAATSAVASEWRALFDRPTHLRPWFYYLYALPGALAPWSPALVPAVADLGRRLRRHRRAAFLAVWLGAGFLMLTATANKQIHYCTLLLAPSALCVGAWADRALRRTSRWPGNLDAIPGFVLLAGGLALACATWLRRPEFSPAAAWWGLAAAVCGLLGRSRFAAGWFPRWPTVAGLGVVALAAAGPLAPQVAGEDLLIPRFAEAAERAGVISAPHVRVVGDRAASLEFYFGRPVTTAPTAAQAFAESRPGDVVILSALRDDLPSPAGLEPVIRVASGRRRIEAYVDAPRR